METANGISKTTTMRLVEHLFDSRLEDLLGQWYEAGYSPPKMAEIITAKGLPVTDVCIRSWIKKLGGRQTLSFPTEGCHESV